MKIAAIDIGSNALRLCIKQTDYGALMTSTDEVHSDEYYERVPLKSGMDVFAHGQILPPTKIKLALALQHFAQMMDRYSVEAYRAVATSAYRDAENGQAVIEAVSEMSGLRVEIISGEEEAHLTRLSFIPAEEQKDDYFLFADVGGGSTELSLLHQGQVVYSHSFKVGSMRYRCNTQDPAEEQALDDKVAEIHRNYAPINYIGVGGCVKFMSKYLNKVKSQPRRGRERLASGRAAVWRSRAASQISNFKYQISTIKVKDFESIYADLQTKTVSEIVSNYRLPEERADILTPASSIFLRIAHGIEADTILVPAIGVRNGILTELYRNRQSAMH